MEKLKHLTVRDTDTSSVSMMLNKGVKSLDKQAVFKYGFSNQAQDIK